MLRRQSTRFPPVGASVIGQSLQRPNSGAIGCKADMPGVRRAGRYDAIGPVSAIGRHPYCSSEASFSPYRSPRLSR
jgi:hypothetical protein